MTERGMDDAPPNVPPSICVALANNDDVHRHAKVPELAGQPNRLLSLVLDLGLDD